MIFNINSGAVKIPINVVPYTNSSFTYDGTTKTPVWQNYDSEQLSIIGDTSATNAGEYTVYFTPKEDYEWSDGTSTPREVTWRIAKATGTLSLSATSDTINGKVGTKKTYTVNYNGDAAISVKSSNTNVATVSISDKTVTVTVVAGGSATITVSVGDCNNYTTPASTACVVTVNTTLYLYKSGNECTETTGGWASVAKYKSPGNGTPTHINPERDPNFIRFSIAGSWYGYGMVWLVKKIDLTNYDRIVVNARHMSNCSYNLANLAVWSSIGEYIDSNIVASNTMQRSSYQEVLTNQLSVANLSGEFYIGCHIGCGENGYTTVDITELYCD